MEAGEEKHELPHWSVWLLVLLGFLISGYALSTLDNSYKGRQDKMEQIKPPDKSELKKREIQKTELESRKTDLLNKGFVKSRK